MSTTNSNRISWAERHGLKVMFAFYIVWTLVALAGLTVEIWAVR